MNRVVYLNLASCNLGTTLTDFPEIAQLLYLNLSKNDITPNILANIVSKFAATLTFLDLSQNPLGGSNNTEASSNGIQQLSTNSMGPPSGNGIQQLFSFLKTSSLAYLLLCDCGINDQDIHTLASGVPPSLAYLSLNGNRITDNGVTDLALHVGNCLSLSIGNNSVTDNGVTTLLSHIGNLTSLNLSSNSDITSTGITELHQLLPELQLRYLQVNSSTQEAKEFSQSSKLLFFCYGDVQIKTQD